MVESVNYMTFIIQRSSTACCTFILPGLDRHSTLLKGGHILRHLRPSPPQSHFNCTILLLFWVDSNTRAKDEKRTLGQVTHLRVCLLMFTLLIKSADTQKNKLVAGRG